MIKEYQIHQKDTGSSQVQIILLNEKIKKLISHLESHPKDFHSKRGLLKMAGKRRRLFNYLKKKDEKRYNELKELIKKN